MSDMSHTSDSENSESLSPTLTVHRLKTILDEVRNHGKFFCIEQMEKQTTQLTNVIGMGHENFSRLPFLKELVPLRF